ncbi:MAG: hypothetical protein KDK62_02155 [Chlamydiia bacterium]|nr:hypothetical protein [Chlamydiia bacterium]
MDFTREPIIETVITPREGYKIVVRSSKAVGQEEYFVDAVEIVSFGGSHFFRSLERPKPFIVPVSDYEVVETREARIVLKNVGLDKSIKIAGGKETKAQPPKEEKKPESESSEAKNEGSKGRRERRRGRGRKKLDNREDKLEENKDDSGEEKPEDKSYDSVDLEPPQDESEEATREGERISESVLSELLTPPPSLISETLDRYRENSMFQSAFYTKEELDSVAEEESPHTETSESFEVSVPEESKPSESQ